MKNYRIKKTAVALGTVALLAGGSWLSSTASAGKVKSVLPSGKSITIGTDSSIIAITPISNDIVRVATLPTGSGEEFVESQAAILAPQVGYRVSSSPSDVLIETDSMKIRVNRATGLLTFLNSKGEEILTEVTGASNLPGNRRISLRAPEGSNFYGAGERGHSLLLNGDSLVMYNRQNYGYGKGDPRISQMNITVPYVVTQNGTGILFDDYSKGSLQLGDEVVYTSKAPWPVAYYVIDGQGSMAGATDGYTALTGRQELPPFWSLGYITSKYGYRTQNEAVGVIDTLKQRGYPVDGMVLDLYWYGQETDMGRLEWNKEQWPDHKKMLADLKKRGVNMVIISQPYINKIGALDNYNDLSAKGMTVRDAEGNNHDVTIWVGESGMFDVSNPQTRDWLWNRYRTLTEEGVEGWWGDLGEPEVHPATIMHHNGLTAEQYHNLYGNEWSRIIYEGYKKDFPDKRLMLLMRGGTAGLQRYSVFPWSTDVARSWEGLQPQVNIMLNSGLSGLGYMSSDLGGFAVDPKNPTDPELYVRWLQMGTFTPTFRTHAQLKPEPYHYPKQEDIAKKFIKMRYQWLPYNYTLAYENATQGAPLARPLNFRGDNPEKEYADVQDEYLWGDNILIAPVLEKGARTRKVLFPAGKWINWNNPSLSYKGGTTATVKSPLHELPMFVKEGSFIPLYMEPIENVTQYDPQLLTVKYFPSEEKTSFTMFDDDRMSTTSLKDGAYQLLKFEGKKSNDAIEISMLKEGTYQGAPEVRLITLEIENVKKSPKEISLSNQMPMPEAKSPKMIRQSGYYFNPATSTLILRMPWDGSKLDISCIF